MQLDVDLSELYEAVDKMTDITERKPVLSTQQKVNILRNYKIKIDNLDTHKTILAVRLHANLLPRDQFCKKMEKITKAKLKLWDKIEDLLGGQNG